MEKRCCSERFCPLEYRKKTLEKLVRRFKAVPNPFVPSGQVASLKNTIEFIKEQKKTCRISRFQPTTASSSPDSHISQEPKPALAGKR